MEEVENEVENSEEVVASKRHRTAYRSAESRVADERPPTVFANISEFNIDPSVLADKRYKFGFVPYVRRNEEIHLEYDTAVRKGWQKASKKEYAQSRRLDDPFRRREDEDDFIRVGGQLMMKRPVETDDAEREFYNEENAHSNQMIEARKLDGPGAMQVYSHSRTRGVGVRRT